MNEQLEELQENFSECDSNGDGQIQFNEFTTLLTNLGAEMDKNEFKIGFKEVDSNADGVINFEEFVAWWTDR